MDYSDSLSDVPKMLAEFWAGCKRDVRKNSHAMIAEVAAQNAIRKARGEE